MARSGRTGTVKKMDAKSASANLGFEAKVWLAASRLRINMDAAEFKYVVLGLIFLVNARMVGEKSDPKNFNSDEGIAA